MQRDFSLDVIRTVAILFVIFYHYNSAIISFISKDMAFFKDHEFTGRTAISLFFILSGASLMLSTHSNYSIINFYKKRFLAIFPLFWFTYIVTLLVLTVVFPRYLFVGINPVQFVYTIIGFDGFLLYYKIQTQYLVGDWFLGCIIILYILFPMLKILFLKNKHLLITASFAICVIIANIYDLNKQPEVSIFPLYRVFEFVFGMYFMYFMSTYNFNLSKIKRIIVAVASCISLIIIVLFEFTNNAFVSYTFVGVLFFVFLFSFSNLSMKYIPKQLIRFISKYSYAAFLVHHAIVIIAVQNSKNILNTTQNSIAMFVALLLFIYLVSYLVYNSLRYLLRNSFAVL